MNNYYLSSVCYLKWLEEPSVYHIKKDELFEVDRDAFDFLRECASRDGGRSDEKEFLDYCLQEGILTHKLEFFERPTVRKSPVPSLRYLELQITDRCNLKCKHCYIGRSQSISLSLNTIIDTLIQFEEMQGLRLLITGGEPLLHNSFLQLNERLKGFGFRKVLFTNGLLLNEELLENLNVHEIQISIDGLEKNHDIIRGKGTFRKAVRAIQMAISKGIEVSVSTMVFSKNLDDFDGLESMLKEMGIKDWTVDVPCVDGYLSENPDLYVSPDVAGKYLMYGFGDGLHSSGEGYACGLHLLSVLPDGRVAKCAFYSEHAVGHITEGLEVCWKRIKPIRLKELTCNCDYLESCRGGCRYRAELSGNPYGKDLFRCYRFGLVKK